MKRFLAMAAIVALAGCWHATVSRSYRLDPADKEGVVIVGSVSDSNVVVFFGAYHQPTNMVYRRRGAPTSFVHQASKGPLQYHVLKFPAGVYVLKEAHRSLGLGFQRTCLGPGTFKFDVRPGTITYIGNISFQFRRVATAGKDLDAARQVLNAYPNLKGEVTEANTERTWFKSDRSGRVCGKR